MADAFDSNEVSSFGLNNSAEELGCRIEPFLVVVFCLNYPSNRNALKTSTLQNQFIYRLFGSRFISSGASWLSS